MDNEPEITDIDVIKALLDCYLNSCVCSGEKYGEFAFRFNLIVEDAIKHVRD